MRLYDYLTWYWHIRGCHVFEDLSAICPLFKVHVPW